MSSQGKQIQPYKSDLTYAHVNEEYYRILNEARIYKKKEKKKVYTHAGEGVQSN